MGSYLPDYQKSAAFSQGALASWTEAAMEYARLVSRLAMANAGGLCVNPCTHVRRLAELLLSLQQEIR